MLIHWHNKNFLFWKAAHVFLLLLLHHNLSKPVVLFKMLQWIDVLTFCSSLLIFYWTKEKPSPFSLPSLYETDAREQFLSLFVGTIAVYSFRGCFPAEKFRLSAFTAEIISLELKNKLLLTDLFCKCWEHLKSMKQQLFCALLYYQLLMGWNGFVAKVY